MRQVVVVLAAAFLAGAGCRAAEDRFTSRVAERLKEVHPGMAAAVVERFHIRVTTTGGDSKEIYLDNLWSECHTPQADCDTAIARYLRLADQDVTATEPYVKPEAIRAVLKDREWLEGASRMIEKGPAAKGNRIVSRPFAGRLSIVYVFDMPDGMRMVSGKDLEALKLDEAALHELALANLEATLPAIAFEPAQPGSAVRLVHAGDSYEASRLLLHERWRKIAEQVKGGLLVAAPTRDFVLFTGSGEDPDGLRVLARRTGQEGGHPLSAQLLRWTTDGWEAVP